MFLSPPSSPAHHGAAGSTVVARGTAINWLCLNRSHRFQGRRRRLTATRIIIPCSKSSEAPPRQTFKKLIAFLPARTILMLASIQRLVRYSKPVVEHMKWHSLYIS